MLGSDGGGGALAHGRSHLAVAVLAHVTHCEDSRQVGGQRLRIESSEYRSWFRPSAKEERLLNRNNTLENAARTTSLQSLGMAFGQVTWKFLIGKSSDASMSMLQMTWSVCFSPAFTK